MSLQNDTSGRGVIGKRAIAAGALINGATQQEAAELAGVTRPTVSRWIQEPEFAETLQGGAAAIVASCVHTLASASAEALGVMLDIMRNGSEYHRFAAAKWILDSAGRYAGMGTTILAEDPPEIVIRWADGESWRDGLNWEDRQWGQGGETGLLRK